MENTNLEAITEELNVQINAIGGFNQGDELMSNAVKDIVELAKAQETLARVENDKIRLELEEKESKSRIKQGWANVGIGIGGILASGALLLALTTMQAIDRHNGDILDKSRESVYRLLMDSLIKNIRIGRRV